MATENLKVTPKRLVDAVKTARKDALVVDFSRIICPHYGKMVEHFSSLEGSPISAHNNKTLFLEAVDVWCRAYLGASNRNRPTAGETDNPKEVVEYVMAPYYEALELDDPSRYKMPRRSPPPTYVGSVEDALCLQLGMCAAVDVTPLGFRFGGKIEDGREVFEHVWGAVYADGKWYDTDIFGTSRLGETPDYPIVKDVEVEL